MKKKIEKLRNISITARLRISFFILSLVPVLIVGVFATRISKDAIMSKSENYTKQIVEVLSSNIEKELDKYMNLMDELILNTTIQQPLRDFEKMSLSQQKDMKENIAYTLRSKFSSYPYIKDVKIINNESQQIYQRGYLLNDSTHIDKIIKTIKKNGGVTNCFSTEIYGKKYVVMSKVIYSIYDRSKVGYIVLVLREEVVGDIYKKIELGEGDNICLIDKNNKILSSKRKDIERDVPEQGELMEQITKDNEQGNKFNLNYKGKDYLMIHETIDAYGLEVVAGIPYAYLHKEITGITRSVVLVISICFVLFMLVSTIISRSITRPLHHLVDYVGQAMEQKFDKDFIDDSKDELGIVGRTFTVITQRMKEMIGQIETEQKEKTELEINMLQAQINPHFLFNTLNSLRWISMMSGANSVSEGILALSDLLRNTIIHKAEYIAIEEELENVKNYILIQKLRYGDLFIVHFEVPEEFLEYKILKFILQPIVENAIIHGGCEEQKIVDIVIKLSETEDGFLFEVIDNGKGFNQNEITQSNHSGKLSGIGVGNVKQRIKLNFGEKYGLDIKSKLGEGTKVTLKIPKIESE